MDTPLRLIFGQLPQKERQSLQGVAAIKAANAYRAALPVLEDQRDALVKEACSDIDGLMNNTAGRLEMGRELRRLDTEIAATPALLAEAEEAAMPTYSKFGGIMLSGLVGTEPVLT